MSDFRLRLNDEYTQLTQRMDKLKNFIASVKFDELPEVDRLDLKSQYIFMTGYLEVLERRVSRLCNENPA